MPKIMHVLDHLSKVNHDKTLWEIPIFGDEIFFGTYIEQTFSKKEKTRNPSPRCLSQIQPSGDQQPCMGTQSAAVLGTAS